MLDVYEPIFTKKAAILLAFLFILFYFFPSVYADTSTAVLDREAQLKSELAQIEADIAAQQTILADKQRESVSLERDIAILSAQIAESKLVIKQKNLVIEQLGGQINEKTATIKNLDNQIETNKSILSQLIRRSNQQEQVSLVTSILQSEHFSDFLSDIDTYATLQKNIYDTFEVIQSDKSTNESQRADLTDRQNKELDAKKVIETEQRKIQSSESEKQKLLSLNKQQESQYQAYLDEKEKRAAEIRSALFALRDSAAIPFGTALQYAQEAQVKTGVRPAFLLAILTQESNLGENVGTCNREGDPPEKHWQEIMPGPGDKSYRDDESAYLRITKALGYNPDTMPLSCPWQGGWGGAMGPSQFIPTTWEAYSTRLAKLLGKDTPDPWNPRDAFFASALYLADLGADKGGYTAERTAALKYYAGGNWYKSQNAFYGNQVMQKAENIQENMIDPLNL